MPLVRSNSGFSGGSVSRRRTDVITAIRPPGLRTRRISSSAAKGSAKRCRAAKQQTPSKQPSRNGSSVALPLIRARLPSAGSSRSAIPRASIVRDASIPSTSPRSPTARANSREKFPGPQATSSTTSPGPRPRRSRAIRTSSAIPGPVIPFTARANAGRQ